MLRESDKLEKDSVAKELFEGKINEEMVFPFPEQPQEDMEILDILLDSIRRLGEDKIDSKKIEEQKCIPDEIMEELRRLGIFGMVIPQEHGGSGVSLTTYCRVMEEIAGIDASVAATVGAHQSIGMKAIMLFGSDEQKKKYLPALATGQELAAYALTEPSGGCDIQGIKTTAVLSDDGKYYILNGSKQWITNGRLADVLTVFAQTKVEIKGELKDRVAAFIVTKDMEGFTIGKDEEKMGISGSVTNALFFENVKVPVENLIGKPEDGFKIAVEVLDEGRLSLGAGTVGVSKKLIELATARAKEREVFGEPIANYELIKEKIFEAVMETYVIESMVYLTTGVVDNGMKDFAIEAAICKIYGSEVLWKIVYHVQQIFAGDGYSKEYPIERILRDARINTIFEGTNEILRMFTALTGLKRPGEELKALSKNLFGPVKIGMKRIFGTNPKITKTHPSLRCYARLIEDATKRLNSIVQKVLIKYGKRVLEKEFIQERLANSIIDLYGMLCVLSRVDSRIRKHGLEKVDKELNILKAFFRRAYKRIIENMVKVEKNDDKIVSAIADSAVEDGGYKFRV